MNEKRKQKCNRKRELNVKDKQTANRILDSLSEALKIPLEIAYLIAFAINKL